MTDSWCSRGDSDSSGIVLGQTRLRDGRSEEAQSLSPHRSFDVAAVSSAGGKGNSGHGSWLRLVLCCATGSAFLQLQTDPGRSHRLSGELIAGGLC